VLAVGAAALGLLAVAEVVSRHPTADGARAAHELAYGRLRGWFWLGGVLLGAVLPLVTALLALATEAPAAVSVLGAGAALTGLAAHEWAWVEAGQAIPLS
jgi:formate-dependent nitrite reductase membrane component NrfD